MSKVNNNWDYLSEWEKQRIHNQYLKVVQEIKNNLANSKLCNLLEKIQKRVKRKLTVMYSVRIEYIDPETETIVHKNMDASVYPMFLLTYPDKAKEKGLIVSRIIVEQQFEEEELVC